MTSRIDTIDRLQEAENLLAVLKVVNIQHLDDAGHEGAHMLIWQVFETLTECIKALEKSRI